MRQHRRAGAGGLARALEACVVTALLVASGCAYYNTFYNAKQLYRKAETERGDRRSGGADAYQQCIDKCLLLLRYYPKSKYVDDALFLIGMSRLSRGEFVQARASFQDLLERFPKSDYAERCCYHMGIAALRQGDAAGAADAFGTLKQRFPQSPLIVECVFRTAEALLDEHDYDKAREDLRVFMRDHPTSRLVPDAQLRLARTYYEEARYEDARREYQRALELAGTAESRYEAELNSALSLRAQAELVLADPVTQARVRARAQSDSTVKQTPKDVPVVAPESPQREPSLPPDLPGGAPDSLEQGSLDSDEALSRADTTRGLSGFGDEELPAGLGRRPFPGIPDPARASRGPGTAVDSASAADLTVSITLPDSVSADLEQERGKATENLAAAAKELDLLRKSAAKLGHKTDLDIELAATRALQGDTEPAIATLDQIARTHRGGEIGVNAYYQIGEIHRRIGRLDKARLAYDSAQHEKPGVPFADAAKKKSTAITLRAAALVKLRDGPETLRRWRAERTPRGTAPAVADTAKSAADSTRSASRPAADSLETRIALDSKFEELASQLLQVAEIDLLELDQPLVALREFQQLLSDYPGSLQSARALFAIAWIYQRRMHDTVRARQGYQRVAHDYPETPQGREALSILERLAEAAPPVEVKSPSSRP